MKIQRKGLLLILFSFILIIAVACSNNTNNEKPKEDNNGMNEPSAEASNDNKNNEENITNESNQSNDNKSNDSGEKTKIVIAYQWGEEAFEKRYRPIEKHLDNIEIEFVPSSNSQQGFEEMFSAGIYPDIIVDQNIFAMQDLDMIYPLDDMIAESEINVEMFDKPMLDSISAYDDDGQILGLPDGTSVFGLYINKDVFDLFGVEYPDPEVPLTWPEVLTLAREMTGERNGVDYVGIDNFSHFALWQFAPTATDPDTGKVLINEKDAYKKYFDMVSEVYSIPGMRNEENVVGSFGGKRAAMSLGTNVYLNHLGEDIEAFDLVPFPVWEDQPDIGPLPGTTPMVIADYSENKEVAFEILKAYFLPEILTEHVRTGGTVPPLSDEDLLTQYARDLDTYEGKNLDAYHVLERATREDQVSRWDSYVDLAGAEQAIKEGKDVVTVLRELEEESTARIEEAMATQ